MKTLLLLLVLSCVQTSIAHVDSAQHQETQLSIILASDMRDLADPVSAAYPQLKSLLAQQRRQTRASFFFFGGGAIGPSAMSNFDRGSHIIDILNSLEPDASGIAKRDFSYFEDELTLRAQEAAFTLVGSNIIDKRSNANLDGLMQHALIRKQGVNIGFISILDERLITQYLLQHIEIIPAEIAIVNQANRLRKMGADIVLLHHFDQYDFIARLLDRQTIDFSFLSDTSLQSTQENTQRVHPRTLVLDRPGHALVLKLPFEKHASVDKFELDLVNLLSFPADPAIQQLVTGYVGRLNRLLDEEVGYWAQQIDTTRVAVRGRENRFANFIVDAMREFGDADIAILNGGSIRGEKVYQPNSVITRRDLTTELPFRSRLKVIEVYGSQIRSALEVAVSNVEQLRGGFPHLSGARLTYNSSLPSGNRIENVTIAGLSLDDERRYRLATTDYLAAGGDGYVALKQGSVPQDFRSRNGILILDLILSNVRVGGKLSSDLQRRIIDSASPDL